MSKDTKDRRDELEALSDEELEAVLEQTSRQHAQLCRRRESQELVKTLARRRALGFAGASITGGRLDVRIEKLFDKIRAEKTKVPVEEVLLVFDGIAGRIISKRLWMALIGIFTILPAIASLWLLASQNKTMIEQNQVEETSDYRNNMLGAMEILNGTLQQSVIEDGQTKFVELPMHHPRIRAEAFETLVTLQKMRWTPEEQSAEPPTRYVEFRGSNLSSLTLGGSLGLLTDLQDKDFSRLYLEGADLSGTTFLNSALHHSVFRNTRADGMVIASPGANGADFSGMMANEAYISADFAAGTPLEIEGANFNGAIIKASTFDQVIFIACTFDKTDLTGTTFKQCNFARCDFTTASLGESTDWSESGLHKSILTNEQLKTVKLPPFCYTEPGEKDGTVRVMTNIDLYNAWYLQRQEVLENLAAEELELLKEKEDRVKEAAK